MAEAGKNFSGKEKRRESTNASKRKEKLVEKRRLGASKTDKKPK